MRYYFLLILKNNKVVVSGLPVTAQCRVREATILIAKRLFPLAHTIKLYMDSHPVLCEVAIVDMDGSHIALELGRATPFEYERRCRRYSRRISLTSDGLYVESSPFLG